MKGKVMKDKLKQYWSAGSLIVIIGVLLIACADKESAPKNINQYLSETQQSQPAQKMDVATPPAYIYRTSSMQSPFDEKTTPSGPLQNFLLTQLTMVGSVKQDNKIWAIVRASNDQVYPLEAGDWVAHEWRVTQITSQQVTMENAKDQIRFLVLGQSVE